MHCLPVSSIVFIGTQGGRCEYPGKGVKEAWVSNPELYTRRECP